MLDYTAAARKEKSIADLAIGLSVADLVQETDAVYNLLVDIIADCTDGEVVFEPMDPEANDPVAATEGEVQLAWTLGHVICHITASNEESAALAAEQARGVAPHGRSRAEVPWQQVTTITQVRQRLDESRRMCKAGLGMWPDAPDLAMLQETWPGGPIVDARGRYLIGFLHTWDHLDQIREIIRQARAFRAAGP
jgi:hypothetical protein